MLIAISDLHFVECPSGVNGSLTFNRNLEPKAYYTFAHTMAREAEVNQATHVELVLAGDIFEMLKSSIWYEDEERPYIHLDKITPGSLLESKILKLLDSIAEEDRVGETLALFRNLSDYFKVPFKLRYLVGNHDRIVNATPATRRKARMMLGMTVDDSYIPHTYTYQPEGIPLAFIRHGHEYDPSNFSKDYRYKEHIPTHIPREVYDAAPLGDFLAIEFGNKLSYLFLQTYGPHAIKNNEQLRSLYDRITEFDDVRPLSATLHFLLTTPGLTPRESWHYLEPIFIETLELLGENSFFLKELKSYGEAGSANASSILTMLRLRPWRKGFPLWMVWRVAKYINKNVGLPSSELYAGREEALYQNGSSVRCVISGHTHTPEVALVNTKQEIEQYHINTGTWRNVVPTSLDREHFGRIKSLAHVVLYGPGENTSSPRSVPTWSFDYWAGYSQKFFN